MKVFHRRSDDTCICIYIHSYTCTCIFSIFVIHFLSLYQLKVLELVEALESSGTYTAKEITEKSSKFRQKLLLVSKYMYMVATCI